ncbi:helix-turn-helix transcriptional regulator [Nocardioides sp. T2.26MG-1]|uniref:helix-turn-helix transcriptional regulator n=1 Tax=Nocardioides sp. T2.26MG-1 TaxID=3041166 RepID=UPI0024778C09|nr:WYL domain-containing protein [Nocardioides sp. T2.26MG-1]CAI9418736.1 Bifunctional ligase/repressor BirA [Nocardioides sp. T2.26MG-1]
MGETATRTLALLSLLQSRSDWSGADLAERLGVSDRTIRHDVARLRDLGYPVDAVRGPGGRYRLGVGAKLPPLLLDDEEAVAVAVGLRAATGVAGVEETSARALAKLEQVLPDRLRRKLNALVRATSAGPVNTDSNVEDPEVDAEVLQTVSVAIRDHEGLRCDYRGEPRELEPYHLVAWQRRWYLVARDPRTDTWDPYRVDWLRLKTPGGRRFTPVDLPEDLTELVVREVARTGWAVHARILVDAPAEAVVARINPAVGTVESHPDGGSVLVTGGDSLEVVAVWISMLGLQFHVTDPPELVEHVRELARRYAAALPAPFPGSTSTAAAPR